MTTLSTVATRAADIKTNPAVRWEAFQRLCEQASDGMLDDLATLYQAFTPKTNRKRYTNRFNWLALALASKDDARYYLRYVQVSESGGAVATDGHRLHVTTLDDRDSGYYRHDGTTVEDTGFTYPNVARVLRDAITDETHPFLEAKQGIVPIPDARKKANAEAYALDLGGDEPVHINRRYADEAMLGADPASVRVGWSGNQTKPVFMHVDSARFAVVMPVNPPK
jgi:hypothetical protein